MLFVSNADNIYVDVGNGNWAEDAINFCDHNYIIECKGDVVGTVGNSGGNYPVHLHFSASRAPEYVTTDRNYIDPIAILTGHTAYTNY